MTASPVLKARMASHSNSANTALDDLNIALNEAHAAGYREGHHEGAQQAELDIQAGPLNDIRSRLAELVARSDAEHRDALRLDAETIVELALTISRWIIGDAARQPEALTRLLSDMLVEAADTEPISVRVSPEAARLLQDSHPGDLRIIPDRTLAPGDLILDTTGPRIEMVVEEALTRASEILLTRCADK